jgi:prevent-host-death family protein
MTEPISSPVPAALGNERGQGYVVQSVHFVRLTLSGGPVTRLTTTEARRNFSDAVNRVSYGGDRIVIDRNGQEVAAIVSIEDLRLLELLEDRLDIEAARSALESGERLDWESFKKDEDLK